LRHHQYMGVNESVYHKIHQEIVLEKEVFFS